MTLRNLPSNFLPTAVDEIDRRLAAICSADGVAIPLAIESGSRAWGFPSPDSDYDCRFLFVRPVDQHLTLWPRRDVIETPLVGEIDANGWELGKALKLLLKGNAVVIEWLRSPIVYRGEAWFRDALLEFASRFANRDLARRHYLHLGERQRDVYLGDREAVIQKKMLYALRSAATLRWFRWHEDVAIAPMHLPTLMAGCDPPAEVARITADLIRRKSLSRELGVEPMPSAIADFIAHEFGIARGELEALSAAPAPEAKREAELFYRQIVHRCSAG